MLVSEWFWSLSLDYNSVEGIQVLTKGRFSVSRSSYILHCRNKWAFVWLASEVDPAGLCVKHKDSHLSPTYLCHKTQTHSKFSPTKKSTAGNSWRLLSTLIVAGYFIEPPNKPRALLSDGVNLAPFPHMLWAACGMYILSPDWLIHLTHRYLVRSKEYPLPTPHPAIWPSWQTHHEPQKKRTANVLKSYTSARKDASGPMTCTATIDTMYHPEQETGCSHGFKFKVY